MLPVDPHRRRILQQRQQEVNIQPPIDWPRRIRILLVTMRSVGLTAYLIWVLVLSGWEHWNGDNNNKAATLVDASSSSSHEDQKSTLHNIWESLAQQLQQQQDSRSRTSSNSRLSGAAHVHTRGGPGSAQRRWWLYENSVRRYAAKENVSEHVVHSLLHHTTPLTQTTASSFSDFTQYLRTAFPPMPPALVKSNRDLIRTMFTHAYDSYMYMAWPAPEVRPITCEPGEFSLIPGIPGLTLIDALDTLIVLGNYTEFARATERIRVLHNSEQLFDRDQDVSVFETTIRVLGGLLSAHQLATAYLSNATTANSEFNVPVPLAQVFASDGSVLWGYEAMNADVLSPETTATGEEEQQENTQQDCVLDEKGECQQQHPKHIKNKTKTPDPSACWAYNDSFYLNLAIDLADRLIPAFYTKTGIPFGTINLQSGVPPDETTVASLAGGGTLCLEFELLSRLTGQARYGRAARRAMRGFWLRRDGELNLLGKHIEINRAKWTETLSGVGSNSDSFYEYLVKYYFLFPEDDNDFWTMMASTYQGVFDHARAGDWYVDTEMNSGVHSGKGRHVLESLMAFYPGMQILLGEVAPAARSLNSFFLVREYLGFLPERFNFGSWQVDSGRGDASLHPLRPELLESCYFLHRANRGIGGSSSSSGWHWAADFSLHKIEGLTRTKCGYSGVRNVKPQTTGQVNATTTLDDHLVNEMPSFFLSETLKYLFLTFDDDNILHRDTERSWIFTTEAHPIHHVPKPTTKEQKRKTSLATEETTSNDAEVNSFISLLRDQMGTAEDGDQWWEEKQQLVMLLRDQKAGRLSHSSQNPGKRLHDEKWASMTKHDSFLLDLSKVEQEQFAAKLDDQGDYFFRISQVLDTFVQEAKSDSLGDVFPTKNWAHTALRKVGVGSGQLLRKSCPNIYSTRLFWVHALNGGAVDYSQSFISITTDVGNGYDNPFASFGAVEALGLLGKGLFLDETYPSETCPLRGSVDTGGSTSVTEEKGQQKKKNLDWNDFKVSTFADGGGFVVDHTASGDKLIVSFISDEQVKGFLFVLAYAGYHMGVPTSKDESSVWRMHHRHSPTDEEFWRKTVMADFHGNSFSCEIELFAKETAHASDNARETLVIVPCAPGLFGRAHIHHIIKNSKNGIFVEGAFSPPVDENEFGCESPCLYNEDGSQLFTENSKYPQTKAESTHGAVRAVHRGNCAFTEKASTMGCASEALIVINDEADELFTMSNGEDVSEFDPDSIPVTVLVTGLDGEDLLLLANSKMTEGKFVAAKVSLKKQNMEVTGEGKFNIPRDRHRWPMVRGQANNLQVFAKGGWGIHASRNSSPDWTLHMLQYNEGA